jgi:hypothetical protein
MDGWNPLVERADNGEAPQGMQARPG